MLHISQSIFKVKFSCLFPPFFPPIGGRKNMRSFSSASTKQIQVSTNTDVIPNGRSPCRDSDRCSTVFCQQPKSRNVRNNGGAFYSHRWKMLSIFLAFFMFQDREKKNPIFNAICRRRWAASEPAEVIVSMGVDLFSLDETRFNCSTCSGRFVCVTR